MRPKATGLAQHGAPLEAGGEWPSFCTWRTPAFSVRYRLSRQELPTCELIEFPTSVVLVDVHNHPQWATSRKEGMARYSSRPMPSLWSVRLGGSSSKVIPSIASTEYGASKCRAKFIASCKDDLSIYSLIPPLCFSLSLNASGQVASFLNAIKQFVSGRETPCTLQRSDPTVFASSRWWPQKTTFSRNIPSRHARRGIFLSKAVHFSKHFSAWRGKKIQHNWNWIFGVKVPND
jgi:hypothetical protein